MSTALSAPAAPATAPADLRVGLLVGQVEALRLQYGANEVREKKPHPALTFLSKFWGLSAWMLEAIAGLSWVLHRDADLAIAVALLILNATIAFVQERRAEGVVDALRRGLTVNARVLANDSGTLCRRGSWCRVTSPASVSVMSFQPTSES